MSRRPVITSSATKRSSTPSFEGVTKRIQNVSSIEKPMRVALYGRAGSGKTTLACTFPNTLLLDIKDEGTDSVADVKGLKVLAAEDWDDIEQVYWYLEGGKHSFKTVVIDTVTQMQDFAIAEVLSKKKKKVEDAGGFGTLTRQEWGDVASLLKVWIMNYRNLPINVVFIAQERVFNAGEESDDPDGQIAPEVGPRLMPSVASTLNAAVDLLGNCFIRESVQKKRVKGKIEEKRSPQYCLRIGPHAYYATKVRKARSVTIPRFLVDPEYGDLIDMKTGD